MKIKNCFALASLICLIGICTMSAQRGGGHRGQGGDVPGGPGRGDRGARRAARQTAIAAWKTAQATWLATITQSLQTYQTTISKIKDSANKAAHQASYNCLAAISKMPPYPPEEQAPDNQPQS